MRRSILGIVVVALWLLIVVPALAQSGSVRVDDPDGVLGGEANVVRDAAQQLANEGADVIVLAAGQSAGTTTASAEDYLNQFLLQNNIASGFTQLNPNQIVFYLARDARYTALRFGQRWINTLRPVERSIQSEQMNPRFVQGDLAGGLVAGINAVRNAINPPISTGVYVIGGVLAATAAGAVAVPALRKRRAAAEALAGARERVAEARRTAGSAIADLGQLVRTAQEKARYDQLSYSRNDVERLQTIQGNGIQLFQQAQAAFDAAEEQQNAKPNLALNDYEAIVSQYNQAHTLAQQATAAVREAERIRAQLDTSGPPSTGKTTRLND